MLVALDFGRDDHADSREELRLLAASAGLRVLAVVEGRRSRPDPALFAGSGKVDEVARACAETGATLVIFNHELSPAQQRNLERRLEQPRGRPHHADPRHLRPARAHARGQAAGRTGPARAPRDAPGARLDPPRAPEGRHRPARSGRDAARDRPPADREAGQGAEGAAREARPAAHGAAPRAHARRGALGLARRLHQRRQVDAVQRADPRRGVRRRPAVRDARHDDAPALPAADRGDHPVRHGRVHPRAAAHAGRGFPRDARGDGACRPAAARRRRFEPDARRPDRGSQQGARRDRRRCDSAAPRLEQDRPERRRAGSRARRVW